MSEIRSQATPARDELAEEWRADLTKVQGDELTIELGRRGASELLELLSPPKPRTVNSADELDALPGGSVVHCSIFTASKTGDWWFRVGTFYALNSENLLRKAEGRTLTVLFTPGEAG